MRPVNLTSGYELPWTATDNPNAWIEPTTHCQLKCPGCFRGVDKPDHVPIHKRLEHVKSQIEHFIKHRNIQTVSIAGGDPLLYPQLYKLVEFIHSKGLRTMIYTNGIALTEARLRKLKECGATQIVIHVDKFQGRTSLNTPKELNVLREIYCEMFRKVKGINLGFIQPLSRNCMDELESNAKFFNANRDIISLVVYTLYREVCWDHKQKPAIDTDITMADVTHRLEELNSFSPAAFLRGTINSAEPSWLFSYSIGYKNKTLGFIDQRLYALIQKRYYSRKKKHLFISRNYQVRKSSLLKILFFKSIFSFFLKHCFSPGRWFGKLYFQTTLILRGPVKTEKGWDLCKGCPDVMLHNGKQVPSCILEDLIVAKKV